MSAIYDWAGDVWRQCKAEYAVEFDAHYESAHKFTKGALLNKRGLSAGIHPPRLFVSDPYFARTYASKRLLTFWEKNPRPMAGEFEKRWFAEHVHDEVPGIESLAPTRSAIYTWASAIWKKCRADYEVELEQHYAAAEEATRGALLSKRGLAAGVDSWQLFTSDIRFARAYGSEELFDFWRTTQRLTFARFERQWMDNFVGERQSESDPLF